MNKQLRQERNFDEVEFISGYVMRLIKLTEQNIKLGKETNGNKKLAKTRQTIISSEYVCGCGKIYKYQSGLCKHKRYCKQTATTSYDVSTGITEQNNQNNMVQTQFIDLLFNF